MAAPSPRFELLKACILVFNRDRRPFTPVAAKMSFPPPAWRGKSIRFHQQGYADKHNHVSTKR
ncbi:hypothetical protein [Leptolyngbya iicbica]|uniref:Uncharacterized protein n=2 Tax=Cyanophyceae TaxID=3028117 RepID=A0A4V2E273_9CYAN|nr:hypothetical protein [Leptolyngbya sp. LK]RZM77252.1 hypothetical protein DYY88_16530 [Leptolyngbya sp. LK]